MGSILYFIIIFSFFIFMLLFPEASFSGAQNGLLLWFQTLLPTLLPFMIISNLLLETNSISYLSKWIHPLFHKIFRVSPHGCYAIMTGFFCGYPMGAKVIGDMVRTHKISLSEGQYLLSFCNNTSPPFIIGYLVTQNIHNQTLILPTLCILISSPILCSFVFRRKYLDKTCTQTIKSYKSTFIFRFSILDHAIMNGFEAITKIGGYMIMFSILFELLKYTPCSFLLPVLEITNGIPYVLSLHLTPAVTYCILLTITSFGGLCAMAQTKSMLQDTPLSVSKYAKEKLITAMVTSLLSLLYTFFILQ